jgi:hypothetical protein
MRLDGKPVDRYVVCVAEEQIMKKVEHGHHHEN